MLSLDNLFAKDGFEALRKWIVSVEKLLPGETLEWHVEPKIDGVAVSLRYEDGIFKTGATRGDGETRRRHYGQSQDAAQRAAAAARQAARRRCWKCAARCICRSRDFSASARK